LVTKICNKTIWLQIYFLAVDKQHESLPLEAMKIERYIPGDMLKPFIKTFMIIESRDGMVSNILPDTSLVIAFRFRGTVTAMIEEQQHVMAPSVISGIRRSARAMEYASDTANLLIVFHEAGAAAFFREPLHELSDISLSLDTLMKGSELAVIEEQLAEADDDLQRIRIAEKWMLTKLTAPAADQLVQHAIQTIQLTHGTIRMKDLAGSLYISQDAFEKRFRRQAGASPKQFSSIVRIKHLIDGYSQTKSLTDAALSAGYFDQAHFIKDFKAFTGKTPQDFFREGQYW